MPQFQADDVITLLVALIVAIPGILAWLDSRKKNKVEIRSGNADTAKKYQEIADLAAKREQELSERVDRLEQLMEAQKYEVRVVFTGGEYPHVEEAVVRHVLVANPAGG